MAALHTRSELAASALIYCTIDPNHTYILGRFRTLIIISKLAKTKTKTFVVQLFTQPHMLTSFSTNQIKSILALILIPSGASKIIAPKHSEDTFPRLPHWFWLPCGVWELVGVFLCSMDYVEMGLSLLYPFMGGVFYANFWMKDCTGKTLSSGKGKMGRLGLVSVLSTVSTFGLLLELDQRVSKQEHASLSVSWPLIPLVLALLGAMWGHYCTHLSLIKKD